MEIRKVQITGGSSYVITLPKEWANSLNIKKNDPLGLIVQMDGSLLITPQIKKEQIQTLKEFDVTNVEDPNYFFRLLIGAYITGYSIIHITSRKKTPPIIRDVVRQFVQMTIGQEIAEETENFIVLKDLLNPGEMPFDKTIKRMYVIVKGMHEEAINALKGGDKTIAEKLLVRDNEVDRLHWLVARQYNLIFKDTILLEKMGITRERTTNYYMIGRILERIGDHAVIVGTNVPTLIEKKINKKIIIKIAQASEFALGILGKSIESLYKKNLKELNKNIESVKKLQSLCEEINTIALLQTGVVALSVGHIVESIRRIGEYAINISENMINHLVGDSY
jgi:phosphate uptake regulator